MPYVTTGLPNNGRTQFFNFQYDDALSAARGRDLAIDLMAHADADLAILASWFSGRQLDMSPPIHVSLNTVATDMSGNPTQFVGGHWIGALVVPLQVTINIGDLPMGIGTPIMLARYLLIAEVSEMYMRAFAPYGSNPWFRFGEGNNGEGLSRFLATKFMLRAYPGLTALPTLAISGGFWNVSGLWLNTARTNFLEVNDEDINPDPVTGCAALFLFYLHDQLGYSIEAIIDAGGGHLSNVYENLTGDSWTNAWGNFSGLVNSHCPNTAVPGGFAPTYSVPLDTVFPVSDLTLFGAPPQATWVPTASPSALTVSVDRPAVVPLTVTILSSHPLVIPTVTITIAASMTNAFMPLFVNLQPASFTSAVVTLTAAYANRVLTRTVTVVRPEAIPLPSLEIEAEKPADPCASAFVEGTAQTFVITNLNIFPNLTGLTFAWSVAGAAAASSSARDLTIASLPPAGTPVTVHVTVTSPGGLKSTGSFSFTTVSAQKTFRDVERELRCRLNRFRNGSLSIPPWTPVEHAGALKERLAALDKQMHAVTAAVTQINALLRQMKDLSREHEAER